MYRQKRHNTGLKKTPIPKQRRDAYTKAYLKKRNMTLEKRKNRKET
jgi:hypothetical protein